MTALALAAVVALTNACGSIAVDSVGATLVSYVPSGGRETLFRSAEKMADDPRHLCFNGGAPICFPWVYDDEGRRADLHGCVWNVEWKRLEAKDENELRFGVEADGYSAECAFRLGKSLDVTFSVRNMIVRDTPRKFCFAFHPFFAVSDVEKVVLRGLSDGDIPGRERLKGVFAAKEAEIVDPGYGRCIRVTSPDTNRLMVWNCGAAPRPCFAPGEWRRFLCLEPANNLAADAISLAPLEQAELRFSVRVEDSL